MAATMLQLQLAQKLMESARALRLHSGYSQPVCVIFIFSGSRPSCSSILCMCAAHATTRQRQDLAQDHGMCHNTLAPVCLPCALCGRCCCRSLHYASLHGHSEVVEYLLQRASDRGLGAR